MTDLETRFKISMCIWRNRNNFERETIVYLIMSSSLLFCSLLSCPHLSVFPSQVLKGSKKLSMSVCSMGWIPGGYVSNHVYTWLDPQGRSVSPPPDLVEQHGSGGRHSDIQQHGHTHIQQEGAEKKVTANECSWWQIDWKLSNLKFRVMLLNICGFSLYVLCHSLYSYWKWQL